ncbi:peptidoglycan D,D-transpeptidase FtsI family protein [Thermoflavimicrobium daqui]|uniref:Serine-type D-Ala-D-Ala carboxypeptidase n=1 Tax=Thermoflavimicrobium daqui TaxID=2137476 RepID=A0A364K655_9BACL|nr:penicillin-binding protein 2 [Thermoflavimicrobium daqui]RAL25773.1 hypothetical protein DL897_06775 [Thermoflavimicrobium daqui]
MRIRGWFVSAGLVLGLMFIMVRLFMIQVVSTRSFSALEADLIQKADAIHQKEVIINSGRGEIIDQVGRSFVGEENLRLFVFPQTEQQLYLRRKQFLQLSRLLGYQKDVLFREMTHLTKPTILTTINGKELILNQVQKTEINKLKIPGVFVVNSDNRVRNKPSAQQVIGRIGRNPSLIKNLYSKEIQSGKYSLQSYIGVTGLEAAFESFLHSEAEKVLNYTTDGRGKALVGAKLFFKEKNSLDPSYSIKTTLNKDIQTRIDKILEEEHVEEGAVVIQEIQTGNILAMSSRPSGNGSSQMKNPWDNRAIMEATPGSIFKTVVAIAALEEGVVRPDTVFHCKGHLQKYKLTDDHKSGHGKITFTEAYAKSCNIVFGQVAEKLGGEKIEAYARRLGLGQEVIWSGKVFKDKEFHQLPQEQTGVIFANNEAKKDLGAVVQAGIGQRDVKLTPIQATNMITSLFHRGKVIRPRIVTAIYDQNGKIYYSFVNQYLPNQKPLKARTINEMQRMMRMVVKGGTATSLNQAKWSLAGKTGTAQVGKDNSLYNKWMIGFGPFAHPKYAVAVVIHSIKTEDDIRAKKIFQKVMDEMFLYENRDKTTKHKIKKRNNPSRLSH